MNRLVYGMNYGFSCFEGLLKLIIKQKKLSKPGQILPKPNIVPAKRPVPFQFVH
jgi:hypothetical protein